MQTPSQRTKTRSAGFTLIELLIVIAIFSILMAIVLVNFASINRRSDVTNAAEDLSSLLREAQSQSMAVINELPHGVFLDSAQNRFTLFEGATYDPLSPANLSTDLPMTVEVKSVSLDGGGAAVLFAPLTGETSNFGEIQLQSNADERITSTITISSQGKIHTE